MKKKDLVQELRELADTHTTMKAPCVGLLELMRGEDCLSVTRDCRSCSKQVLDALADRIEAEYDPKPEPDTVEKVAKDMYVMFHEVAYIVAEFKGKDFTAIAEGYHKRLEALGVTFDA